MAIPDEPTPNTGFEEDDRGFVTWKIRFAPVDPDKIREIGPAFYQGMPFKDGSRTANQLKTGDFEVFLGYEGHDGEGDPEERMNEELEWNTSSSDEPIEAHPFREKLIEGWGGYYDQENRLRFPPYRPADLAEAGLAAAGEVSGFGLAAVVQAASSLAAELAEVEPNEMNGAETYIARHRVLRHTFASRRFPKKEAELDGKVIEGGDLPNETPGGPREGRNYMVFVQKVKYRGDGDVGAYDVELNYIESEEGGWKPQYTVVA